MTPQWKLTISREDATHALPGLLLGVGMFFIMDGSLLDRVVAGVVGGFVLHGVLLLAYVMVFHVVGRLAGRDEPALPPRSLALTAALLLTAGSLALGQHWMRRREREIERCLWQLPLEATVRTATGMDDAVYTCLHPDAVDVYDED